MAAKSKTPVYHCKSCNKPMNPVDYMVGQVCLACTKKAHKQATGGKGKSCPVVRSRSVKACPVCRATRVTAMGTLGNLKWYRCQCCGMEFNVPFKGIKWNS